MARIPGIDPDDPGLDPTTAAIVKGARDAYAEASGHVNIYTLLAHHPQVLQGLVPWATAIYEGNSLPPAERELAYLATSTELECFY